MKKNEFLTAVTAVISSVLLITALPINSFAEEAASEGSTTEIVIENDTPSNADAQQTTAALREGDTYAINKVILQEKDGVIPGGYTLVQLTEETQQALYANGGSRIVILAQNYKENMKELDVFADSTSAMLKIRNMTSACDTIFSEPVESKVAGFRAIIYDYDIIQYEFVDETTKQQVDTFKGRNYYFYSDDDVYAIMFDTNAANWEEQSKCLEEFIDAIEIEGSNNITSNPGFIALIAVAVAVVIACVVTAVVIAKKKKKA